MSQTSDNRQMHFDHIIHLLSLDPRRPSESSCERHLRFNPSLLRSLDEEKQDQASVLSLPDSQGWIAKLPDRPIGQIGNQRDAAFADSNLSLASLAYESSAHLPSNHPQESSGYRISDVRYPRLTVFPPEPKPSKMR